HTEYIQPLKVILQYQVSGLRKTSLSIPNACAILSTSTLPIRFVLYIVRFFPLAGRSPASSTNAFCASSFFFSQNFSISKASLYSFSKDSQVSVSMNVIGGDLVRTYSQKDSILSIILD